jgi:hypothetical protein
LSWAPNVAPDMGEDKVDVVLEVNVPKFEQLALGLLCHPKAATP